MGSQYISVTFVSIVRVFGKMVDIMEYVASAIILLSCNISNIEERATIERKVIILLKNKREVVSTKHDIDLINAYL